MNESGREGRKEERAENVRASQPRVSCAWPQGPQSSDGLGQAVGGAKVVSRTKEQRL